MEAEGAEEEPEEEVSGTGWSLPLLPLVSGFLFSSWPLAWALGQLRLLVSSLLQTPWHLCPPSDCSYLRPKPRPGVHAGALTRGWPCT